MKKLADFINRALAAAGINTGAAAFAATFLFVVAVLVFADHTNTAALILLAMLTVPILFNRSTPTPFEIASVAGAFLEGACTTLKDKLSVFRDLYYDSFPIEETGQYHYYPRWEWKTYNCNGHTVVEIGLLRLSKSDLSATTLSQERRVLQNLLSDDLRRGMLPNVAHPAFTDGTPTLYLLDIKESNSYIVFDFVWVDSKKVADFVHRFDLPPTGSDIADDDF